MNTYFFESKERHIKFHEAFASMQYHHELKAQHFVMWNIIRGLPPQRGFTPIQRQIRIDNGHAPYSAFCEAIRQLTFIRKYARELIAYSQKGVFEKIVSKLSSFERDNQIRQKGWINEFLKPFNEALTAEDITRIAVPVIGWDPTGKMTCDGVILKVK